MEDMDRKQMIEKIVELLNKLSTTKAVYDIWVIVNLLYDRGR